MLQHPLRIGILYFVLYVQYIYILNIVFQNIYGSNIFYNVTAVWISVICNTHSYVCKIHTTSTKSMSE